MHAVAQRLWIAISVTLMLTPISASPSSTQTPAVFRRLQCALVASAHFERITKHSIAARTADTAAFHKFQSPLAYNQQTATKVAAAAEATNLMKYCLVFAEMRG